MSNKLTNLIATLGTNLNFVSFFAHVGFSFMILCFFPSVLTILALVAGCAAKEFWFDAKYEVPTQTSSDNWTDFIGYMAGVAIWCVWVLFG